MRPPLIFGPLILAVLSLAGCVGSPPIIAAPSACSTLLPSEWLAGVPSAPLPGGETVWTGLPSAMRPLANSTKVMTVTSPQSGSWLGAKRATVKR